LHYHMALTVQRKTSVKKLKARGLHELVIDEIGTRVLSGEFVPGSPLPAEMALCESLGVSRTALREALRVLASKGLVEPRRKIGTVVRPMTDWNFLDADVLSWRLDGRDPERVIDELYELRLLIEPMAASLAARHATKADLQILRAAYKEMREAGDDGERIAAPDLKFHQAIIAASGNRLFSSLAKVVRAALAVNFELVREAPSGHPSSMPAHKKVLDAIAAQSPAAAKLAMQKLIEHSQQEAKIAGRRVTRRPADARATRRRG
jgi:DNA-binding FadR family transcriptional regulator